MPGERNITSLTCNNGVKIDTASVPAVLVPRTLQKVNALQQHYHRIGQNPACILLPPQYAASIGETLRGLADKLSVVAISHPSTLMEVAERVYPVEEGGVRWIAEGKPRIQPSAVSS